MLLGLEKSIKIPEAALNILVSGHLWKPHLQEDLPILGSNLNRNVVWYYTTSKTLFEWKEKNNLMIKYCLKREDPEIIFNYLHYLPFNYFTVYLFQVKRRKPLIEDEGIQQQSLYPGHPGYRASMMLFSILH